MPKLKLTSSEMQRGGSHKLANIIKNEASGCEGRLVGQQSVSGGLRDKMQQRVAGNYVKICENCIKNPSKIDQSRPKWCPRALRKRYWKHLFFGRRILSQGGCFFSPFWRHLSDFGAILGPTGFRRGCQNHIFSQKINIK